MNSFFRRHRVAILWAVLGSFVFGSIILFAFNRIFYYQRSRPQGPEAETVLVAGGVEFARSTLDQAYRNLVDTYERFYRSLGLDFTEQLAGTDGLFRQQTLRAQAAEGLIYQVIVTQEAKKLGISVSKSELNQATEERYQEYLQSLGVTEDRFEEYLRSRGQTLAQFKADLRNQVRFQLLEKKLKAFIVGPIDPTEEDLKAYYEENKDRYREEPEKVKVAYILIKEDKELANQVLEKAKAPDADFAELVEEYSQDEKAKENGGIIDWFSRGESDLPWDVEGKAFELDEGEVTLVEYGNDFYILKVLGKKPAVYKPFEEVKEDLKKTYIQEKEREKWEAWRKEKREQIQLEVKDPVLAAFIAYGEGDKNDALDRLLAAKQTMLDPNLDYYIGRIYEDLYLDVGKEVAELEKKEERTEEEEAKLSELKEKQEQYKKKAVEYYIAFAEEGEGDEALYKRITALEPQNAYALTRLGDLYFDRELYVEAERWYDQAVNADPEMVEAIVGQGNVAMALGLYDRAQDRYKKALELRPDDNTIKLKLAEAYLKGKKLSEARPLIEAVLSASPSNDRALKLMGDLLMAEGKPKEAIDYYERAVERNPAWDYRLVLGDAYRAAGDVDKALDIYERVKNRYPYRYEPYARLAEVYKEEGDTEEALFWYGEALKRTTDTQVKEDLAKAIVELSPEDLKARFRLANYYYQNYKYSAAIEQYQYILSRSPNDIDAILGIGDCYVGKTQYDEAIKWYKQALSLSKDDEERIGILGRIIEADKKKVGPKGKLTQEGLEALWQRALIYKRLGRTEEAKKDLQEIYDTDPTFRADELIPWLKELGVEVEEQTPSVAPVPEAGPQTPSAGETQG
jgi:tetratricopeptide (TPR) repeat protein